jgi:hypothetical protein
MLSLMIITKRKDPRRGSEKRKRKVYKSSTMKKNSCLIRFAKRKVRRNSLKKIKNRSRSRRLPIDKDSLQPCNKQRIGRRMKRMSRLLSHLNKRRKLSQSW